MLKSEYILIFFLVFTLNKQSAGAAERITDCAAVQRAKTKLPEVFNQ